MSDGIVRDILEKIVKGNTKNTYPFFGTVLSVDVSKKSCTVEPSNGDADILDVKLIADQSKAILLIPKIGSKVVVSMFDKDNAFIELTSEVDKIEITIDSQKLEIDTNGFVFNTGNFGGLIKIEELVNKLNRIENDINTLKQIFSTSWIPVPNDGGAALKTAAAAWSGNQLNPITSVSNLENTKVKHGG